MALVHSTTTKIITSSLIVAPPSLLHYDALSLEHAIEEEIITLEHEGSLKLVVPRWRDPRYHTEGVKVKDALKPSNEIAGSHTRTLPSFQQQLYRHGGS